MSVRYEIKFVNNPDKVFHTGDYLEGIIRLELVKEKHFRRITLKFDGVEKVQGVENSPKFCDYEEELFKDTRLLPGIHDFPFKFWCVQPRFPSSFEGEYGFIRYFITAFMEISDQEILEEFKCPLTIINRIEGHDFQVCKKKSNEFNKFYL